MQVFYISMTLKQGWRYWASAKCTRGGRKKRNVEFKHEKNNDFTADYHPVYTPEVSSAVSTQRRIVKMLILYISPSLLLSTSHKLTVNQTSWELMCQIFSY